MGKQKNKPAQAAPPPKNDAPPVAITDEPADNQFVQHEGKAYTTVKEGRAYILIPPDAPRLLDPKTHANEPAQSVFYNPIQQYNRDLTVLAIRAFGEDYLAKQAVNKKKRKKRPAHKKNDDDKQDHEAGEGQIEPEVAEIARPNKRKRDDEVALAAETKRQKVTASEGAEFEDDGGINDEDLLAVESSMQESAPSSAAREEIDMKSHTIETPQNKKDEAQTATAEQSKEEQDTRPQFRILDALSATGLRALRYAQELPFNTHVTANDLSKKAVEAIKLNVKHNQLQHKIKTSVGNANAHMYSFVTSEGAGGPGNKYHVIDLDPYGTAVPFLDAAVQATADNGLLCVTCTDTGVFNSVGYAEKAFALYGGVPGRGDHCHEIGLRLILHAIATAAAKYGVAIEPLLSLSIDYYARVFVRVKRSPADVKFLASKSMLVYACDHGCGAWYPQFMMRAHEQAGKRGSTFFKHIVAQGPSTERLCECCGGKMHVAGPMWGGALHNPSFVQKVLDLIPEVEKDAVYGTLKRVEGMLSVALEEMMIQELGRLLVPAEEAKQMNGKNQANGTEKQNSAEKMEVVSKETGAPGQTTETTELPTANIEEISETVDTNTETISAAPATAEKTTSSTDPKTTNSVQEDSKQAKGKSEPPKDSSFLAIQPSFRDTHPFYIIPSSISRVLHVQSPPDAAFRGALRSIGYQAVRSHAQPGTIKTDAPWSAIWDIMVAWSKTHPIREGALTEGSAGWGVLRRAEEREQRRKEEQAQQEQRKDGTESGDVVKRKREIVFDEKLGRENLGASGKRLVRYQINPRANWGPMARAK